MELFAGRLRAGVNTGEPFAAAGATVIPRAWSLVVDFPNFAWTWNMPIGVDVDRNGVVERAVVVDVTRWTLIGLTVLLFFTGGLGIRSSLRKGFQS